MRMEKQKFERRNTYTPTDASLVCSSVAVSLNREETLGEHGLKTLPNIPEENQPSKRGQDLRVPVINLRSEPLMPTTSKKAKALLKQKKAKVVKRIPFVIQLTTATGETKQELTVGIDSGYSKVGFSVTTEKEEVASGKLTLRKDVSKKLGERKMYRKQRRNKLWYRPPRFDNRKRKEGWLPPSLQHKLDTHVRLIEHFKKWFPVTKTVIEVATFDAQKMQNPEISGIEYQQGELQGYHIKEYLLEKWGRTCIYCKKKNVPLEIEHITPKSKGGSNRISNLTISCRKCNSKKDNQTAKEFGFPDIQKQAKETLKQTAFMNVIRKRLAEHVDAEETFGYVTKYGRIVNDLDKSHVNDAFVIAGGSDQKRCKLYMVMQIRRNNRSLQTNRKGYKPSIRRKRYKIQPNDLVEYKDSLEKVKGVHDYGRRVVLKNSKDVNVKDIMLVYYGKGLQFMLEEKKEMKSQFIPFNEELKRLPLGGDEPG